MSEPKAAALVACIYPSCGARATQRDGQGEWCDKHVPTMPVDFLTPVDAAPAVPRRPPVTTDGGHFICQGCPWRDLGRNHLSARTHEQSTGHRVTLWDGPTSQMPRSYWTDEGTETEPDPASSALVGTVRDLWGCVSLAVEDADTLDLLDMAFRNAIDLHPDYRDQHHLLMKERSDRPSVTHAAHGCSGYSQTGGERRRYVMRCWCGWCTTPRATYERGMTALAVHVAQAGRSGDAHE